MMYWIKSKVRTNHSKPSDQRSSSSDNNNINNDILDKDKGVSTTNINTTRNSIGQNDSNSDPNWENPLNQHHNHNHHHHRMSIQDDEPKEIDDEDISEPPQDITMMQNDEDYQKLRFLISPTKNSADNHNHNHHNLNYHSYAVSNMQAQQNYHQIGQPSHNNNHHNNNHHHHNQHQNCHKRSSSYNAIHAIAATSGNINYQNSPLSQFQQSMQLQSAQSQQQQQQLHLSTHLTSNIYQHQRKSVLLQSAYDETMRNGSAGSSSQQSEKSCEVYRPFQTPPDFKLAKLHGLAKKIGKINVVTTAIEAGECCICCHLPFKKTPFKITEDIEQYASLGPAFTLFFQYTKQTIALLTIYFFIGGWMNLIESYRSCDDSSQCSSFLGIVYSRSGEKSCSDEFFTPQILNFIAFWVLFVGVVLCKISQDHKEWEVTENQAKHSDFTLMVSNVPETQCEEELIRFLEANLEIDRGRSSSQQQKKQDAAEEEEQQYSDDDLRNYEQIPEDRVKIACVNRVFRIQEYYRLAREKIRILNSYHDLMRKVRKSEEDLANGVSSNASPAVIAGGESVEQHAHAGKSAGGTQKNRGSNQKKSNQRRLLKDEAESKKLKREYLAKRKEIESSMSENQAEIQELEKMYTDYASEEIRTSIVLVTFESYAHCQAVREKYINHNRFQQQALTFKGRDLKFKHAYEPLDIIWENLEISFQHKLLRRTISLLVAILLMLGSLSAVSAVTMWQRGIFNEQMSRLEHKSAKNQQQHSEEIRGYALSFLCTVIIATINSVLTVIVTLFSKFEKHNTFTEASVSISMRLSWIQFVNTALVPFVMFVIMTPPEEIVTDSHFTSSKSAIDRSNEYLAYVTQNIFFIFIGNALLVPITVTFEIEYVYKKFRQWYVLRKAKSGRTCTKTQQQVNEIFEDPEFLVQEYYATTNRIVLSGFFYATMLSLGILIKCMTMLVLYWSFKFTFVRHSAYPKCLSNSLNSAMQMLLFFIPLIFTAGNLIYGWVFLKCDSSEIFNVYNIIQLSFGVALIIFRSVFIRFFQLFTSKKQSLLKSYSHERRYMGLSYNQMNPISRAFDPENKQIELKESLHEQEEMQQQQQQNLMLVQQQVSEKDEECDNDDDQEAEEKEEQGLQNRNKKDSISNNNRGDNIEKKYSSHESSVPLSQHSNRDRDNMMLMLVSDENMLGRSISGTAAGAGSGGSGDDNFIGSSSIPHASGVQQQTPTAATAQTAKIASSPFTVVAGESEMSAGMKNQKKKFNKPTSASMMSNQFGTSMKIGGGGKGVTTVGAAVGVFTGIGSADQDKSCYSSSSHKGDQSFRSFNGVNHNYLNHVDGLSKTTTMKKGGATFVGGQTMFGNAVTPTAATPNAGGESMRAKAHTSIIDYAFESMFLSRERQNQIISAAFERNQIDSRMHPSPAFSYSKSPKIESTDYPSPSQQQQLMQQQQLQGYSLL